MKIGQIFSLPDDVQIFKEDLPESLDDKLQKSIVHTTESKDNAPLSPKTKAFNRKKMIEGEE